MFAVPNENQEVLEQTFAKHFPCRAATGGPIASYDDGFKDESGVYPSESHAAAPGMLPLRFIGEVCWARFVPPLKRGRCWSIVHIPVRWVCGL